MSETLTSPDFSAQSVALTLPTPTPHILQQPVSLRQPIQAIIPLPHRPHKPAQRIHLVLPRVPTILIDFSDRDLHRRVVFGFNYAIGGATLPGDIAMRLTGEIGCRRRARVFGGIEAYRSTSSPFSFSMVRKVVLAIGGGICGLWWVGLLVPW